MRSWPLKHHVYGRTNAEVRPRPPELPAHPERWPSCGRNLPGHGATPVVLSRPPRIQLLGLLPAILKPCGPACAQPFTNKSVETLKEEEWRETPEFVRENADRAHRLAERLLRDYGHRIRIEVVGLDSPRGAWLDIRHREGVRGNCRRSRSVSKFGRLRPREASRGSGAHASRVAHLRVVSRRLSNVDVPF